MTSLLHQKLSRTAALRPAKMQGSVPRADDLPAAAEELARMVAATPLRNSYGEYLSVRRWFDGHDCGGSLDPALRRLLTEVPREALDPAQWLFLDTETTGLAGGTGTYAFLVGLAWWDAGGLEVEQLFLRDYSEEHAVLEALAARMTERRVLVTFNGRSFDWPLLETRYRMTRRIPAASPAAHLDLLHPARQLWRVKLGSVRLMDLEQHVLLPLGGVDWRREGDIPGALIPQAYFSYLRGGGPEALSQVFRHNQMDLRGLAALAARLVALLTGQDAATGDALELYGLSRLEQRRGAPEGARRLYERALAAGLPEEADRAARRELARLAKRERDFGRATELWEDILGETRDGLDAYEQLAIYYEHRAGAPERALELTREALAALRLAWQRGTVPPAVYRRLRERLGKRLERLEGGRAPRDSGAGLFAPRTLPRASKKNPVSSALSSAHLNARSG
jgi:uncharacterized protein YprB with RNaseH-like and TPR domain